MQNDTANCQVTIAKQPTLRHDTLGLDDIGRWGWGAVLVEQKLLGLLQRLLGLQQLVPIIPELLPLLDAVQGRVRPGRCPQLRAIPDQLLLVLNDRRAILLNLLLRGMIGDGWRRVILQLGDLPTALSRQAGSIGRRGVRAQDPTEAEYHEGDGSSGDIHQLDMATGIRDCKPGTGITSRR
jgi:hypothetical protein